MACEFTETELTWIDNMGKWLVASGGNLAWLRAALIGFSATPAPPAEPLQNTDGETLQNTDGEPLFDT